jgi:hypothetical protein
LLFDVSNKSKVTFHMGASESQLMAHGL